TGVGCRGRGGRQPRQSYFGRRDALGKTDAVYIHRERHFEIGGVSRAAQCLRGTACDVSTDRRFVSNAGGTKPSLYRRGRRFYRRGGDFLKDRDVNPAGSRIGAPITPPEPTPPPPPRP